jgi:hypothetical protein
VFRASFDFLPTHFFGVAANFTAGKNIVQALISRSWTSWAVFEADLETYCILFASITTLKLIFMPVPKV